MQQYGVVRVASIYNISLISDEEGVIQLQIEVEEYRFSNDTGMETDTVIYTIDIEKSTGVGMTSPYQVVRFLVD